MFSVEDISKRLSKSQILKYATISNNHPTGTTSILSWMENDNIEVVKNAAWIMGHVGESKTEQLLLHFNQLQYLLHHAKHPAVSRNILRVLQYTTIPEDNKGELYTTCLGFILNPKVPVAIRAFSMTVCANISKEHPELKNELLLALSTIETNGTPGIKSRIKNTLKQLKPL
jgi:hypothetical protein